MGAFRSGTNYLRYLLEKNFLCVVHSHSYGWKHGPVPVDVRETEAAKLPLPVLSVSKDPYAFCTSLFTYYQKSGLNIDAGKDWPSFLTSPITIFNTKAADSPQYRFSSPVHYWNFVNWNLSHLPNQGSRAFHFRYDDLLTGSETAVQVAASALSLVRRSAEWDEPAAPMARMPEGDEAWKRPFAANQSFDTGKYQNRAYLANYDKAQLAFVAGHVDSVLMALLGYDVVDAEGTA